MGNKNNANQQRPVQPAQNQKPVQPEQQVQTPAQPSQPANAAPVVNVPVVNPDPVVQPAPAASVQNNAQVNDFMNNPGVPAVTVNVPATPDTTVSTSAGTVNINVPVTPEAAVITQPQVSVSAPPPVNVAPNVSSGGTMTLTSNNNELMENIKNYFDGKLDNIQRQGQETTDKTQKLELSLDKIAARVAALEEGKKVASATPRKPVVRNVQVREVVRKAPVERVVEPKRIAPVVENERVIASKPVRQSSVSGEELVIVRKTSPEAPRYKIHSLFNGRMWIENSDNTHSSYSVNDRLPNGELIKSIDMEKDLVTTDRGTIKAK